MAKVDGLEKQSTSAVTGTQSGAVDISYQDLISWLRALLDLKLNSNITSLSSHMESKMDSMKTNTDSKLDTIEALMDNKI